MKPVSLVPSLLLAVAVCALATPVDCASATDDQPTVSIVKLPGDIAFKPAPNGAPQSAVLYGDPKKPGLFVTRVKFLAGWKDPPHTHPDAARTVAVLSGTLYFGSGDTWDESKLKAYPAGTFYSEPPGAAHFTWAKDGDVIIQISGIGPSGKTFINK